MNIYVKAKDLRQGQKVFVTHPQSGETVKAFVHDPKQELARSGNIPGIFSFRAVTRTRHPEGDNGELFPNDFTVTIYCTPNDLIPCPI